MTLSIPDVVARKARNAGAGAWLAGLPSLVADLSREWSITVGRPLEGGTEAYVAEAAMADGTPAVLKLIVPRDDDAAANEILVLQLAGGEGCARLHRADAARGALLMERLGPSLFELGLPLARRLEILCDVAGRVWRPAPGVALPTGADKARWLIDHIASQWEALGRPCSARAVEHALACARRRLAAHDAGRARLVHGDVHQWNTLRAGDGFALVDPDGLLAEPEYDLGILMREDPEDLLRDGPRLRARWLAARTGLSEEAIWEWGVAERVSTGLVLLAAGMQPNGRGMLEVAERIAAGEG